MSEVEIRKFQTGDAVSVKALVTNILQAEFPRDFKAYPSGDLDDIEDSYGKLGEAFFVACADGKIVGTVGIKQDDQRTALLRRLFVDDPFRGKHLGSQLADRAIEFCKEVGYDELVFKTTSSMQSAIELGRKKGFIAKARINLGDVELVKFALHLKNNNVKAAS